MTDQDTAPEKPAFVQLEGAPLTQHFINGSDGNFRVVGSQGIPPGRLGMQIFQIREINLNQPVQKPQG